MTICFFGTYDQQYSRNTSLLLGLSSVGATIHEVHLQLEQTALNSTQHVGVWAVAKRVLRKCSFLPIVIKKFHLIRQSDVILCAYPGHLDMPLAWIVSKILRKPLIFDPLFSLTDVFLHDFSVVKKRSIKSMLFYAWEWTIFRLADMILADTPYQKENYHTFFGIKKEHIVVVPLSADTKKYTVPKNSHPHTDFRVIYYGLYNPIHGVEHIIDAARLCAGDSDISFIMVGDGQTYNDAVHRAHTYGLQNVQFLRLHEAEALPILATADIFLGLFGKSETAARTIPNKVLQGLAMKKVVITGSGKGIKSFFTDKRDLVIIPQEDPRALADAILALKGDPVLMSAIADRGYEVFKAVFTPEASAQACISAIKSQFGPFIRAK